MQFLKMARHHRAMEALAQHDRTGGANPPPLTVQMNLSDFCNHDCPFCAYRLNGYPSNAMFAAPGERQPKRMIDYFKAGELISDAAALGARSFEFTGGGEPSIHPEFATLAKLAADRFEGNVGLVTNGQTWRPLLGSYDNDAARPRKLFRWVRVSIDAGRGETHKRLHGGNFDAVLDNLHRYRPLTHKLGASFVIVRENLEDIVKFARLMADSGVVDYVRYGDVWHTDPHYYGQTFESAASESIEQAAAVVAGSAMKVVNDFTRRRERLERPTYCRCRQQQIAVYIGGDLNLYRCCRTAYNAHGLLGSVANARLLDVWPTLDLSSFDARSCDACPHGAKNRAINYLLDQDSDCFFV